MMHTEFIQLARWKMLNIETRFFCQPNYVRLKLMIDLTFFCTTFLNNIFLIIQGVYRYLIFQLEKFEIIMVVIGTIAYKIRKNYP